MSAPALPDGPLVAWYGDDFTGSAAVMEVLAFAGLPAVLFLDLPTAEQLARFPGARGIGIAGTARSHGRDWMERNLPPIFDRLAALGAPLVHYKVCSTLDSSPSVGSIGLAIDLADSHFGGRFVPCLVAAPPMRRYQVFGHLFAAAPGGVFRLDRHPVMARHPVTPMDESDVARTLARQTVRPTATLDIEALEADPDAALDAMAGDGRVICLDCMTQDHVARCGRLIWERRAAAPFVVGSQGVEYALVAHWQATGALAACAPSPGAGPARMVAVSGSVSPVTAAQIDWSRDNGFQSVQLDAAAVACGGEAAEVAAGRATAAALAALDAGRDPLIHTAAGPDDPAVAAFRSAVSTAGLDPEAANHRVGRALGRILADLLHRSGIRRAVISGGDTSGHAGRELGIFALTARAPTIPGAALFTAHSEDGALDGIDLALKGGQMGSPDYFGWIRDGGGLDRPLR